MGAVKAWMMDMEYFTNEALTSQYLNLYPCSEEQCLAYVKYKLGNIDEGYCRRLYKELVGGVVDDYGR